MGIWFQKKIRAWLGTLKPAEIAQSADKEIINGKTKCIRLILPNKEVFVSNQIYPEKVVQTKLYKLILTFRKLK